MRPRNFDDVLAKITGAKQHGDNWTAPCPLSGHKHPAGHLSLKDGGDKCLAHCLRGRHTYEEICAWLGFTSLAYSSNGGGGGIPHAVKPVIVLSPPEIKHENTITPQNHESVSPVIAGVTVAALAEAKHLPIDFLKSLGTSDFKYLGLPAVRIPYHQTTGAESAIRFRLAMSGESRFKWRKGDHPLPYGLNRLPKSGPVLIVEGESDCWTCWLHGIPALGAPGKGIWPEAWAEYLKGLDVTVWCEPDAQDFVLRVLKTAPNLKYITAPAGVKDISEAHIQGLDVPTWLASLPTLDGQALQARTTDSESKRLYLEAKNVIEAADPLALIEQAIRALGFGGDIRPAMITYLSMTSRLLEMQRGSMPVHLLLAGPSSGGKSYTLGTVKALMPAEAVHSIDASSPRTLIYDPAPLKHRALIFGEADSLPAGEDNNAASAVRALLQEHRLSYDVTIRDAETGEYTVKHIDKEGPTVLITTSTRRLGEQLSTRLFTLEISDSHEQIVAALRMQAALKISGTTAPDTALVAFQSWLQLQAPCRVFVPFSMELGEGMVGMATAPRVSRDFARVTSLIESTALIRQHHRQTDSDGRIVAELADYTYVRELINDMFVETTSGATLDTRALVEAVIELDKSKAAFERITNVTLSKHLAIGPMAAGRRAKRALKLGWLVNREQRKFHPADYGPGEVMPQVEGLPVITHDNSLKIHGVISNSSTNQATDNTITPLTVASAPPPIPCYKGKGYCDIRTDPALSFQCGKEPEACCWRRAISPEMTPTERGL